VSLYITSPLLLHKLLLLQKVRVILILHNAAFEILVLAAQILNHTIQCCCWWCFCCSRCSYYFGCCINGHHALQTILVHIGLLQFKWCGCLLNLSLLLQLKLLRFEVYFDCSCDCCCWTADLSCCYNNLRYCNGILLMLILLSAFAMRCYWCFILLCF